MKSKRYLHEIFIVCCLCFLVGCSSGHKRLTRNIEEIDSMRKIVEEYIPLETVPGHGKKFLTQEGFTCRDEKDYQGGPYKGDDFIFCERRDGGVMIFDRWVVVLVHEYDEVKEIEVDKNYHDILE